MEERKELFSLYEEEIEKNINFFKVDFIGYKKYLKKNEKNKILNKINFLIEKEKKLSLLYNDSISNFEKFLNLYDDVLIDLYIQNTKKIYITYQKLKDFLSTIESFKSQIFFLKKNIQLHIEYTYRKRKTVTDSINKETLQLHPDIFFLDLIQNKIKEIEENLKHKTDVLNKYIFFVKNIIEYKKEEIKKL